MSTILEEKKFNPRLTKSKEEFIELMANLKLDLPKMIGESAVPSLLSLIHYSQILLFQTTWSVVCTDSSPIVCLTETMVKVLTC